VIPIDVARLNLQAAGWGNELNRLASGGSELKLNPVFSAAGDVRSALNAYKIWAKVAVKIGNRKLRAWRNGSDGRIRKIARC
jgi:hypothetical protein